LLIAAAALGAQQLEQHASREVAQLREAVAGSCGVASAGGVSPVVGKDVLVCGVCKPATASRSWATSRLACCSSC
jgi:hypothetical protein